MLRAALALMAASFLSSGSLAISDLLNGLLNRFEICLYVLPTKAADEHITDAAVFFVHESGWHLGGRTHGFGFHVKDNPRACQVC